jgi:hypothetical protein
MCRPASAQSASPPQLDRARAERTDQSGFLQLRTGATYRRLYNIPILAGEFGAAIGGWDERGSDYVAFDVIAPGRTENGLAFWGGALGYRGDWQLSVRFRVGFSAGLAVVGLSRETTEDAIASGGFALSGFAGWDLLRSQSGVLALDLALNTDPTFGDSTTVVWGPTLGLSYRL